MADYIQIAGKSEIFIGFPSDEFATVEKIGEQINDTQLAVNPILHRVPGDAHGGPEGDGIEEQLLGFTVEGQLDLSKWDPEVKRKIERFNLLTRDGAIADSQIGALLRRDRSFRVLIYPAKSNPIGATNAGFGAAETDDYFARNFVCCIIDKPIVLGQGTKFSQLRFSFTAHRAPAGHAIYTKSGAVYTSDQGIVWDRDLTGSPYEPESP